MLDNADTWVALCCVFFFLLCFALLSASIFIQLPEDQHALTYLTDISIARGADYSKDIRDFELTFVRP